MDISLVHTQSAIVDNTRMSGLDLAQPQPQPQNGGDMTAAPDLSFYVFADAASQPSQPPQPRQHQFTQSVSPCGPCLVPEAMAMDGLEPGIRRHTGFLNSSSLSPATTSPAAAHMGQNLFVLGHDEPYACWSQDGMDLDYDPELASWVNSWVPPQYLPQHTEQLPPTVSPFQQQQPFPLQQDQQQLNEEQQRQEQQQQLLQVQQQVQQQARQQAQQDFKQQQQQQQQQQNQHQPQLQHGNQQLLPLQQPQQQQPQQQRQQQPQQQQPQQQQPQQQQLQQTQFAQQPLPHSQNAVPALGLELPTANYAAGTVKNKTVLGPDDFLFPDDETAAAAKSPLPPQNLADLQVPTNPPLALNQAKSVPPAPVLDLNDPTTLDLYDQMLLFSRGGGPKGEKLIFNDCGPAKESILCRLAMKLKLEYVYDPAERQACVWSLSVVQTATGAAQLERQTPEQTTLQAAQTTAETTAQTTAPTSTQEFAQTSAQIAVQASKETMVPMIAQSSALGSTLPVPPPAPSSAQPTEEQRSVQSTAGFAGSMPDAPAEQLALSSQSVPPSQPLPEPPLSLRSQAGMMKQKTQRKRHTISSAPATFSLVQQNTNTAGLMVGLTPPPMTQTGNDNDSPDVYAALSVSTMSDQVLSGQGLADEENDQDGPSLSDRLSSSWSIFHSGISSRRPRGRRGPLSARSRKDIKNLEWAGGACWRCKILRRKCDPGAPCKNCPAPDLREDAPPWPLIGCRRGNLPDAMPPRVLCTKSRALLESCAHKLPAILAAENVVDSATGGPPPCQPDAVSQCFREAEAQCLSDNKLVLDNPSLYLRARNNSAAAQHFSQSIRNGRYRANDTLNKACHVHERALSYSDLIAGIAWDLADNGECLGILEIESIESFMLLLETACLYEVEIGKSAMVGLSMVCLRCCLDALRLHSASLLDARLHSTCQSDLCSVNCLRELAKCIDSYIEELSLLMFRKVNLRDRRWWLSTFYSLCIQAYVRRALLVIEQRLLFPDADDVDVLFSSQYLHLVTVLFIAVSFQYDPLVTSNGGLRLQQALLVEEDGASTDLFVPDRYFSAGRAACSVDQWADEGIKSSYQFLTRLLNIGSLDFDTGQGEGGGSGGDGDGDVCMEGSDTVSRKPRRPLYGVKSDSFSGYSTPNSSTTSFASSFSGPRSAGASGIMSPPSSCGPVPSSTSSPRTSLFLSERRSSIGSLPSRLSVASFPSFQSAGTDLYSSSSRLPHSAKPTPLHSHAAAHGAPGSLSMTAAATPADAAGDNNSNVFVCTCCLKRPRRFDTLEALKKHQMEKPHICASCGRRFSRMNEAERHIITIHLRPYSWSCHRLVNPLLAFQRMSDGTMSFDVCGFCGKQFPRDVISDVDQKTTITTVTAKHAAELTAHVQVDHRLHECKASSKKFYREDMFGQHLKLSHAAEPGVWLKYLENVCKADEKENKEPAGTEV